MSDVSKASTDLMGYLQSLLMDAYHAGVRKGLHLAVKWGLEDVSVNHSLLEKTAIAVLRDTITTPIALDIPYTRQLLNLLLWCPSPALQVILVHPPVSSVYVTTEGRCIVCVMLQGAACAVRMWKGSNVTAVNLDTTPSQTARRVSVMGLVWLTMSAVQVDNAFASPTMGDRSVTNVLQATMDTQIVLPANVRLKARMAIRATHCRVSACVCQGWWASSVTAVPLDSGSPSAQLPSVSVTQQEPRSPIRKRACATVCQM